jgi:hypothetical protein
VDSLYGFYIIHHGTKARLIRNPDWDGDWTERYFPGADPDDVCAWSVDGVAETKNEEAGGIFFNEELAGPDGMSFMLLPEPKHSADDLANAKQWLKYTRDVVKIYVRRIEFMKEEASAETGN